MLLIFFTHVFSISICIFQSDVSSHGEMLKFVFYGFFLVLGLEFRAYTWDTPPVLFCVCVCVCVCVHVCVKGFLR
jgi:hypothetical protein